MSEPFIGEIKMFGGNFAPRNYAFCDGQLLPIAQNSALFSILGTMYGGDGRTTFGLPDLRGRVPMHFGQGPGLTNRRSGEKGGTEDHLHKVLPIAASGFADSDPKSTAADSASNMQPFQCIAFIIAIQGIFPSRN